MSCSVCAGYSSYNCPCCGEEVSMVTCPDCEGTGLTPYKAWHIHLRRAVECTKAAWYCLPTSEDEAYAKRENFCRMERTVCPTCKGEGQISEHY